MARLEAGYFSVEKKLHSAQEMIHEVADAYSSLAAAKTINLRQETEERAILVECDHDRIIQILSNLVGNAIKFTPEKGTVILGVKALDGEVEFRVSDTGAGIPQVDLPHVFDQYWQSKEGRKIKGSAGLGLYIAMKMIEAHHGRIWVESAPGQGTTFFFSLPRAESAYRDVERSA